MTIDDNRKKHIWAVAELMRKFALEKGFSQQEADDLYLLGLLHDIGYAFLEKENYSLHNKVGEEFLKKQGYVHWKEVSFHGVAKSPYQSKFLDILNWAKHIDSKGNFVSFEERLKDISSRYAIPVEDLESKKTC